MAINLLMPTTANTVAALPSPSSNDKYKWPPSVPACSVAKWKKRLSSVRGVIKGGLFFFRFRRCCFACVVVARCSDRVETEIASYSVLPPPPLLPSPQPI